MEKTIAIGLSIALTAVCWGIYGPILHWGQGPMGGRMRPFICVGLAYFVVAVMVPVLLLSMGWEPDGKWDGKGFFFSFLGGALGAIGALGIVLAMSYGGSPSYVMPMVFGCAPVFNTLWVAYWQNSFKDQSPMTMSIYFAGIIMAVVGAVIVFTFAPKPKGTPGKDTHGKTAAVAPVEKKPEEPKDNRVWHRPG